MPKIPVKNLLFPSVESFIATMETPDCELDRGEHETNILFANLLRRALLKGMSNAIQLAIEVNLGSGRADAILFGEDSSGVETAVLLEFKQWSKVTHLGGLEYEAVKWGAKADQFEYGKTGCPTHQVSTYAHAVAAHPTMLPGAHVEHAVVLLNAPKETCREFLMQSRVSRGRVYSYSDLETVAHWLATTLQGSVSSTVGIPPASSPYSIMVDNISGTFEDPVTDSRHGWVGTAERFIQDARNHRLLPSFMDQKIEERRAIVFSSNALACVLRSLWHTNKALIQSLGVVLEYRLLSNRVDTVIVGVDDSQKITKLLLVELKGWGQESVFDIQRKPSNSASNPKRGVYSYAAFGGSTRMTKHPIEQVTEYMKLMSEERDEKLSAVAWLHNIADELPAKSVGGTTDFGKRVLHKPVRYFQHHITEEPTPLLTRGKRYDCSLAKPVDQNMESLLEITFADRGKCSRSSLKTLVSPAKYSTVAINDALKFTQEAEEILTKEQKKIYSIIKTAIDEANESRKNGTKKKSTFVIEADAGTGKTLLSLAALGHALQLTERNVKRTLCPKMIVANTPTGKQFRADSDQMIHGHSISTSTISPLKDFTGQGTANDDRFQSGKEGFILYNLLHERITSNNQPLFMVFDEAQMLPSTTEHGLSVGFSTYFGPIELAKINTDLEPLKYGNDSYLSLKLETLIDLADVTVFFLDPRQSTSGKHMDFLTKASLDEAKRAGAFVNRQLISSLKLTETKRGSPRFNAFLKNVLYGEKKPCAIRIRKRKNSDYSFEVHTDPDTFFPKMNAEIEKSPWGCGLLATYIPDHISVKNPTANDWIFDTSFADPDQHEGLNIEGAEVKWAYQWNKQSSTMTETLTQRRVAYVKTAQGTEIEHNFVIFGKDMFYDKSSKKICINVHEHNQKSPCREGNDITKQERAILNQYWVLLTRGRKSCTVLCEDPDLAKFLEDTWPSF